MKKTFKILLTSVLILSLLFALGGCHKKQEPAEKYKDLIEDFVPDHFNYQELAVGEVDKPTAAVWAEGNVFGLVKVVSTDENVVTVSKGGKVTAVAEGSAYVIFAIEIPFLGTVMSEIYHYNVCATIWEKYASDFDSNWFNTITLGLGQQNTPTSAIWVKGGGQAYSSDETVITVDDNGTVTAVGLGQAYVVYIASTDMHETYLFNVTDEDVAMLPTLPIGG
jgi:hypothetical protein